MRYNSIMPAVAVVLAITGLAHAETMITCSGANGYGFYMEGGLVPSGKGGWREDAITGGSISLVKDEAGQLDILSADSSGLKSARAEGGKVILMPSAESLVVVLVAYGQATEQFVFDITSSPQQLVWTSVRFNGSINKASVFRSTCR